MGKEFQKGINQVLEAVAKSLETGRVELDSPNLKRANVLNVNLLARNLNRLVDLGYKLPLLKKEKQWKQEQRQRKITSNNSMRNSMN
jgi:hypothetical protein